jgi:chemotaxis methyl-accepting protein methylase
LLAEPEHRPALIFALFIPRHHGGGFDRYPGQMAFLTPWLQQLRSRQARIRCLDAACGSGEGTWELALALMAAGFALDDVLIHGTSLDTLELFAAGHGFFPHNLLHQEAVRQRISPALAAGLGNAIRFFPEDLLQPGPVDALYDLILCNGAIGGPFIHEPAQMETALKGLAGRLAPGGVLMMANRFHGGWGKTVTKGDIAHLARRVGLEARWGDEGVVAVKRPATATTIPEG